MAKIIDLNIERAKRGLPVPRLASFGRLQGRRVEGYSPPPKQISLAERRRRQPIERFTFRTCTECKGNGFNGEPTATSWPPVCGHCGGTGIDPNIPGAS